MNNSKQTQTPRKTKKLSWIATFNGPGTLIFKHLKRCPLCNSNYTTFRKRQNDGGCKKINGFQGLGRTEGWVNSTEGFQAVNLFSMILEAWRHVIIHLWKTTHCTTPRMNSHVKCGLWGTMVTQCSSSIVISRPLWYRGSTRREALCVWGEMGCTGTLWTLYSILPWSWLITSKYKVFWTCYYHKWA